MSVAPYGLELPADRARRYAAAHCQTCGERDGLRRLRNGEFDCGSCEVARARLEEARERGRKALSGRFYPGNG